MLHADCLLDLLFNPEDLGDKVLRALLAACFIHSVISQKIEFFITTDVGNSNPKQ
jgi:hypothetical protein